MEFLGLRFILLTFTTFTIVNAQACQLLYIMDPPFIRDRIDDCSGFIFGKVNGNWGQWVDWSSCNVTCGQGIQTRCRDCNNPTPRCGGEHCGGSSIDTIQCNIPSVDGMWGHWTDWSQCSVTCGQGTIERERKCNNPAPMCGGELCVGDHFDRGQCEIKPVNGGWGQWGQYGRCSHSCGNGIQIRTRECNNPPPTDCGEKCSGPSNETHICNTKECPGEQSQDDKSENIINLTGVWPVYGPEAGGTRITIHGSHIPVDSVIVIAQNIYCETVFINESMVIGITPKLTSKLRDYLDIILPITLLTDYSRQLSTDQNFIYKTNPSITNVYPLGTIIRGGTYLTAKGENLDSVATITMETTMILQELVSPKLLIYNQTFTKYETACITLNHTSVKCPTPSFDLSSEFTNDKQDTQKGGNAKAKSRSKREAKIEFSNDGDILEFFIGFSMDGVDDYKNYSSIDVFVEPEFKLGTAVQQYTIGERLIFEGKHLDAGLTQQDYNITIGTDVCSHIKLVSNTLSCSPPEHEPEMATVNEYNLPRIMVHVGIHIEHMAGYLRYPEKSLPLYMIIAFATIPASIVLIIVVTVSVVCAKKRKAGAKSAKEEAKE